VNYYSELMITIFTDSILNSILSNNFRYLQKDGNGAQNLNRGNAEKHSQDGKKLTDAEKLTTHLNVPSDSPAPSMGSSFSMKNVAQNAQEMTSSFKQAVSNAMSSSFQQNFKKGDLDAHLVGTSGNTGNGSTGNGNPPHAANTSLAEANTSPNTVKTVNTVTTSSPLKQTLQNVVNDTASVMQTVVQDSVTSVGVVGNVVADNLTANTARHVVNTGVGVMNTGVDQVGRLFGAIGNASGITSPMSSLLNSKS
jgi:hypothetical protein